MAKRRGRKKGSKNKVYQPATAIKPCCMKCGSEKLRQVHGAPPVVRQLTGQLADGRTYHSVRWQRSVCECGQHLSVKTYLAEENTSPIVSPPTGSEAGSK